MAYEERYLTGKSLGLFIFLYQSRNLHKKLVVVLKSPLTSGKLKEIEEKLFTLFKYV
jgi:hypothetical protein